MTHSLNATLNQTNLVVSQVAQSVGQMQSVSQDLATSAQEQSSAVEEVTSNLESTDGQIKASAASASAANQLVQQAAALADAGQHKMQSLTGAMQAIAASSQEIGKIIKVIDDIAFQTNPARLERRRSKRPAPARPAAALPSSPKKSATLAERSAKAAKSTAELIEGSGQRVARGRQAHRCDRCGPWVRSSPMSSRSRTSWPRSPRRSDEQAKSLAQINKAMGQVQ